MHQPRLPLPSSTGRCRSSNVDSTRLFAKFGPRRKKAHQGRGWLGGCQPPARFAKCGVGAKLAAKLLRRPLSSSSSYLLPLSFSRQKWGSFGQTETDADGETSARAIACFLSPREFAGVIHLLRKLGHHKSGAAEGVDDDGIPPFSRGFPRLVRSRPPAEIREFDSWTVFCGGRYCITFYGFGTGDRDRRMPRE